jgi:hypothetical protein
MCRFVEQTINMPKGSWREPSYTLLDIQNHISDLRSIWFSRLHSLNKGQAVRSKDFLLEALVANNEHRTLMACK